METVQIVRIKDVIIEKVSANDEELKRIFGCSKRQAGERRREMQKLPSQQKHLLDSGQLVTIKGFYEYLQYRGTKALEKRNGNKQENEVSRMNLLSRIKNYFSEEVKETNLDWKEVALDLNQSLIETQEKLQEANQEIADLKKIVAIYKEKEKEK
ncbi:Uncharacterised protein [Streptococcus pneumoniae]|nr:Uncharacterised protein [Streptococcus pneumoniae]